MSDEFRPKPFHCEVERRDGVTYLKPLGEFDLATAPVVEERLRELTEHGARRIVLDLRGLTFMDSTGITLVTRWHNDSRRDGFEFALVRGDERIRRLFAITGLDEYLTFVAG